MVKYYIGFTLSSKINDYDEAKKYLEDADMTEILLDETDVSQFKDKIVNISWRLVDSWIGYIVLTANAELSDKELEIISDWVDTQNSDGLGEGFSEQDFAFDEENDEYAGITTYYDCKFTKFDQERIMKKITFRYRDSYSNREWRTQHCIVPSVDECIKIYGLDDNSVDYEILEIEDC